MLGPLDRAEVTGGELECPWHGYRYDVRTGRSCDGRNLRLHPAPEVQIDSVTGQVMLIAATEE